VRGPALGRRVGLDGAIERAEKPGGIGKAMNDKAAFRQLGDEVRAVSFIVFYEENANAARSADIGGRACGALVGSALHANHSPHGLDETPQKTGR
jgi:hypothetical protein